MPRPYVHRLRVRYGECDPQGIVFNANYFAYFDVAITELWRDELAGYQQMMERGIDIVVGAASATFRTPARFDDELALELTVTHLGTTSMVSRIRVLRGDELCVEGEIRHVFVDLATLQKTPIPDDIRAALERHAEADGAAEREVA
jgi:acyl-CoA thioester hydrolase